MSTRSQKRSKKRKYFNKHVPEQKKRKLKNSTDNTECEHNKNNENNDKIENNDNNDNNDDNQNNIKNNSKENVKNEDDDIDIDDSKQNEKYKKNFISRTINIVKHHQFIIASCEQHNYSLCKRELTDCLEKLIEEYLKSENFKKDQLCIQNENHLSNASDSNKINNNTDNNESKQEAQEIKDDKTNKENKSEDTDAKDNNKSDYNNNNNKNDDNDNKNPITANPWVDIASEIKNEIESQEQSKHCKWVKGPTSALVFIHIMNPSIDCVNLLRYVFEKFSSDKGILPSYIYKIIPIQMSCYSTHEGILEVCRKLIPKAFENEPKPQTFAIVLKNRSQNHDNSQRLQLIKEIASCVPAGFTVDLNNPQIVISVQTFGKAAGVSIIKNEEWKRFKQYSLMEA